MTHFMEHFGLKLDKKIKKNGWCVQYTFVAKKIKEV